ncbi:MAG TPA: biopolymer transporter ExbD [Candidatus Acidoferrum sp.]|jgi:biopolymer transport protein TolR|nr:biopolymer transporter ExbD [Candidatus Acidoferrum sp.]HXJ11102.1 biopolymer transporter ExbD [Candidatus Limnocylindrales bacterium]
MPQLAKSTQSSLSEINMVPFIDVVLVLLIIFMITAPILQSGIEVDVPKTHTVKEITQQRLVVTMDKNQLLYLGNDPINIHQLADKIKKQSKSQKDVIYLRADETVPFGAFCTVIDTLRQSGISNISIVTQPINDRNR